MYKLALSLVVVAAPLCAQSTDERLDQLESLLQSQQKRIEFLEQRVSDQQQVIDVIRPTRDETELTAYLRPAVYTPLPPEPEPVVTAAATRDTGGPSEANVADEPESPLRFQLGKASLTPFGFVDYILYLRDTAVGSGVGTNFGSIPYRDTVRGNLEERRQSAQSTRVGMRIDSAVKGWDLLGYIEADFLGLAPDNLVVNSFSDTFRLRLGFFNARRNHFEILAGQSWSLMTPNRKGVSPLPSDVYTSLDIDQNYNAGLIWTRAPQLRFAWHPNQKFSLAVSAEASEQYGGGSGGAGKVTLPSELASAYETQLNRGGGGIGIPTTRLDNVVKAAFDFPVGGKPFHIEASGLLRSFAFYNPQTATNFTAYGGGGSVNLNFEVLKGFRLIANSFVGNGGGRYLFGQAPDVIIRPDGSPELVRSISGLTGFEVQVTPRLTAYANYGLYYSGRRSVIDPATGDPIGWGYTGSPDNHNRVIHEPSAGLSFSVFKNPQIGNLLLQGQYAHYIRHPWFVAPGRPGVAKNNSIYLNLRYVLPGSPPPGHSWK